VTQQIKPIRVTAFQKLACPLDNLALVQKDSSWRCESGHSYDIARQGYTHLLPVQNTRSRNPGDSKEMIDARQRFLNTSFYQPIANALNKITLKNIPQTASVLDAGCGEGYYLRQLAAENQPDQTLEMIGLDISKPAILSAAKQHKKINWVVASNANIPVLSETIDRLICMFGFPVYSEFARVLKPDGKLILVESGPQHLQELRKIIYPVLNEQKQKEIVLDDFLTKSTQSLTYQIDITEKQFITDLLTMTPHLFRASAEGKIKAAQLNSLSLTIDVRLSCLEKQN